MDETARGVRIWVRKSISGQVFVGAILFGGSGRLDWWEGWGYFSVILLLTLVCAIFILPRNPGLLADRTKIRAGTKAWDVWLVALGAGVGLFGVMVVGALDARFGWSPALPAAAQVAGLVLSLAGFVGLLGWAMAVNAFFVTTVRIQEERGHTVVDSGPYRFVRHPGYVGVILMQLASPILLGSLWALIPGVFSVCVFVLRTALEDRTLKRELPGYAEYAERVRHRLLPGVW